MDSPFRFTSLSFLHSRYTVTNSYESAIENLEKALKCSPEHENAKIYLAHTLQLEAKRFALAPSLQF